MTYLCNIVAVFAAAFIGIVWFAKSEEEHRLSFEEYKMAARLSFVVTVAVVVVGAVFFDFLPWLLVDVLWGYW